MTTPGSQFPIIGKPAWWVIPEGTAGVIIGQATGAPALFTVTQSQTKPNGAVAGPYGNQLQAQAKANALNASANSANPLNTNPVSGALTGVNAIGDLAQRLTQSSTWIRVGEVLGGALLLYLGAQAAMRGTATGDAVKRTVSTGKRVAELVPK